MCKWFPEYKTVLKQNTSECQLSVLYCLHFYICLFTCLSVSLLVSCLCLSECQLPFALSFTVSVFFVCLFVSLWWWSCWMHLGAMLLNVSHPSLYCPTKLIPLCPTLLSNQTSNFECHSLVFTLWPSTPPLSFKASLE